MVDLPTPPLHEEMAIIFLTLDKEKGLLLKGNLILNGRLKPEVFHLGNQQQLRPHHAASAFLPQP